MVWITPDAPTQAELDSCVTCGLCLPHCPTFRLTGDETASPRGRLTAMRTVAEGSAAMDDTFQDMMSFCLQCRACEAVCPSMVPFGRAMEGTRIEIAAQAPTTARRVRHRLLDRVLPSRRLMRALTTVAALAQRLRIDRIALGHRLRGLRRLPLRGRSITATTTTGTGSRGVAAVLAGCVMDPWFAPVHEATIGLLRRAGYEVVVGNAQTCCGALAAHDGAAPTAHRLAETNVAAFRDADIVVVNAAGCGAHMKEYGNWADGGAELAERVRDVTEVIGELIATGVLPTVPPSGVPVAVQDPCHLRHAQRITGHPRGMLRAAGYDFVDIDPKGLCCGAAGLYTLVEAETAARLGAQKAEQVVSSGATIVASANPGCEIQLRTHLGEGYDVRHPVELYWEALEGREKAR